MSDSKRQRLLETGRTEEEGRQKRTHPCSEHQQNISQNSLDHWLQKKPNRIQTNPLPEPEEPLKCAGIITTPVTTDPGDSLQKRRTHKITDFFSRASEKSVCSRVSAPGLADGRLVSSDVTWLGVDLSHLKRTPECSGPLPALKPNDTHTVMIRSDQLCPGNVPVPFPDKVCDRWSDTHVKMPCSPDNLFPGDSTTLQSRWDLISKVLTNTFNSSHDVKDAILKYNAGQARRWDFTALHLYCKSLQESEAAQLFGSLIPAMAQLALRVRSVCTQPIPLLMSQRCHSITLSQEQVSCLLVNAFFCTFPRRNSRKTEFSNYPDINFSRLFEGSSKRKQEKLKTLLCYFKRVTQNMPCGLITYTRQCLQCFPEWSSSEKCLRKLHIMCDGTIEDQGCGALQVDFANRFVGGGVTGSGLVQEEIRFLINPELIAARLFTEVLDDNECLIITGSEQFSRYSGYSDTYRWDGNHDDQTPRDEWQRRCTEIVAMDALHYRNFLQQFHPENMTRELNKAFCAFARPGVKTENLSAVATGNWGCGAFGGDTRLKAVLQLMAAAEAHRDLIYFTFGDRELLRDVHNIHTLITERHATVGSVFSVLLQYYECVCKETSRRKPQETLYCFLSAHL